MKEIWLIGMRNRIRSEIFIMFDPTIFENIKVVLEGEIYDIDLSGEILVTNREDRVDLAKMARKFIMQFKLANAIKDILSEIHLSVDTEDLMKEISEIKNDLKPGCEIIVTFILKIIEPKRECEIIRNKLNKIWGHRPSINQKVFFYFGESGIDGEYFDEITLSFGRKIDEDNIEDISRLVKYTIQTLKIL